MSGYVLTLLIVRKPLQYHVGGAQWSEDIDRACLYSPVQAVRRLKALSKKDPSIEFRAVLQDKSFNFYDGKRFVYHISKARIYTPEEASRRLAGLK